MHKQELLFAADCGSLEQCKNSLLCGFMILNVVPINESYHIPSFFTDKLPFFDTSHERKIVGGKSKQPLEV